jgi:hypothetical protein
MSIFVTYNKVGGKITSITSGSSDTDLSSYEDSTTSAMFVDTGTNPLVSKVSNGVVVPIEETDFSQETLENVRREIKEIRFMNLLSSDWTQIPDVPLTAEKIAAWKEYRQAMRDMPEITDSELENVRRAKDLVWPVAPSN